MRRIRRELWLSLATFALDRALELCRMPEDEKTIRAIRSAAAGMLTEDEA